MKQPTLGCVVAGFLCVAVMACSKTEVYSTSLAITVVSDLSVHTEVNRLEVEYEKASLGKRATQHLDLTANAAFPITLVPLVSKSSVTEAMKIRVTALLNGVPVVSQRLTAFLIQDQAAELTVHLNRICAAATCDDASHTCIEGQCVNVPLRVPTLRGPGGDGVTEDSDALPNSDTLPIVQPPDAAVPLDGCNLDSECPTGHCVGGLCCDTACNSKCQACNLPGKEGTCSGVPANTPDPHGRCIKSPPCGPTGLCDTNGECAPAGKTEMCGEPQSCKDAKYTPQSFCDGAGTCVNATAGPCPNGFICGAGMCKGSCALDEDCGFVTLYCEGTACKQKLANGVACIAGKGNTCTSGNCVDGVCCGSASCGSCHACNLNGAGSCSPVMGGVIDPKGTCQDQAPAVPCGTTGRCDGSGACAYHPVGKACGAGESCSTATYTAASKCDGKGECMNAAPAACPKNLKCLSSTQCIGSCSTDAACASPSQSCSSGRCEVRICNGVPKLKLTLVVRLDKAVMAIHQPTKASPLFVASRNGLVSIVGSGRLNGTFLNLTSSVREAGERGLLGLAFHPQYDTNGRFFVYYTQRATDPIVAGAEGNIVIAEGKRSANPEVAETTLKLVLTIDHSVHSNNNGGMIGFGKDGMLYAGTGDGGASGDPFKAAQDTKSRLGKLLRIDVDNPSARPIGNMPLPADKHVWSYGLRNPWRWSFDRGTGDLYIGDVGQDSREEIHVVPASGLKAGLNFGWSVMEGTKCFSGANCDMSGKEIPVTEYVHAPPVTSRSVIGGYVYRGSKIPCLVGRYLYGDHITNTIWSFSFSGGKANEATDLTTDLSTGPTPILGLTTFGEDADGEVYLADLVGNVYRIDAE